MAPIYLAIKGFPIDIFPDFEAAYLQAGATLAPMPLAALTITTASNR